MHGFEATDNIHMVCKFYFAELIPIKYELIPNDIGDTLIKPGVTGNIDAKKRFDPKFNPVYRTDFKIKILFSCPHPDMSLALQMEEYWLNQFPYSGPNKVNLEKYLGAPAGRYDNIGATEIRLVKYKQAMDVVSTLYNNLSKNERYHKQRVKENFYE